MAVAISSDRQVTKATEPVGGGAPSQRMWLLGEG